jgi:hypothetical protein
MEMLLFPFVFSFFEILKIYILFGSEDPFLLIFHLQKNYRPFSFLLNSSAVQMNKSDDRIPRHTFCLLPVISRDIYIHEDRFNRIFPDLNRRS